MRKQAPSLEEQRADVARQERMKFLVAEADAKWAAKPRLMDAPNQATEQPQPVLEVGPNVAQTTEEQPEPTDGSEGRDGATDTGSRRETWQKMRQEPKSRGPDPWREVQRRGGPSEEWQPKGWDPTSASKKS